MLASVKVNGTEEEEEAEARRRRRSSRMVALGCDVELSTRSWMAGGRVALYNGKASGVKFHQLPAYPSGKDGLRSKAPYFDKDRRVHTVAGSAFARFKTSYGIISRHVSDANKLNVMPTSRMRMTGWNGQL